MVTYEERRLDGKIPPLGWLDVTDLARQYLNLDLGVDTTYTYHFMSDSSKEEIAICTTDKGALQVVRVQYKYVKPAPSTGIKTADLKIPSLSVFPNPASDALNIRAEAQAGAVFSLKIFSIVGQEVWHKIPEESSGILDEAVDISGLKNGLYLLRVSTVQGQTGQVFFVKE
ncbi:MAG: T9SS type A sorting domain-containing protein [Bacteroidia bacterium]